MAFFPASAGAAQTCGGTPGWDSLDVTESLRHPDGFRKEGGGVALLLVPTDHGWRIAVESADGRTLPVFALPKFPAETNPINIAGWHFRNLDNTGPNTGEVNAPQHARRFTFSLMPGSADNTGMSGLGEVSLLRFELSPTVPGHRARMMSLEFSACLNWPSPPDRQSPLVSADPSVAFETVASAMIGCGFDQARFSMSDRMAQGRQGGQAPYLKPDLDGDWIPDMVVPATRLSDQAPGLAICLVGDETLIMAGYAGPIGAHLDPSYFGTADFWAIHRGPVPQGIAEGPPPDLRGDAIFLGKQEKSSVILYLSSAGKLDSYWQGD